MTEPAEEARTRQGLYRFCSSALRPPEPSTWAQLQPAAAVLASRDMARFAYATDWLRLVDALGGQVADDEIESEYVRLFGVGPASTPAPPTESSYRVPERDGQTGAFVAGVQAEYLKMGVPTFRGTEPPDHISSEMEAMSYLCRTEAHAWKAAAVDEALNALKLQRGFLDRHLAIWVPLFAGRTRSARPAEPYASLVEFLHAFVVHEKNLAAMRVEIVQAS